MQKKISMNKQEIAQGLSPFVMMAFVDAQNLETGFLTRHRINKLTKEQIMGFSMETEKIINKLSHQLEQVADGNIPTDYECGTIFQYVFDKVTEALYKLLMGDEVDTQFNLKASYICPNRFRYKYELFKIYKETNNIRKANEIADHISRMPVKINSPTIFAIKKDIDNFLHYSCE